MWHHLRIRKARTVDLSAIRIPPTYAAGTKRDLRESWLWWRGKELPFLEVTRIHNQLVLGRSLGIGERRPWESASRPVSPQQARRTMTKVIGSVGTPAAWYPNPAEKRLGGIPQRSSVPPNDPMYGDSEARETDNLNDKLTKKK